MMVSSGFNMVNLFFVIFIGFFIFAIISNLVQWQKNNASPILTVEAKVLDKRKKRHHHHHNNHHHTTTSYYVTFRVKSGDTMDFRVKRSLYMEIHEETHGQLTFQGTRYISFSDSLNR